MEFWKKLGRWRIAIWLPVLFLFIHYGKLDWFLVIICFLALIEINIRDYPKDSFWVFLANAHVSVGTVCAISTEPRELAFILAIVVANDTAALYGGRLCKFMGLMASQIFPKTSPNKTWGGFFAGVFAGALAGYLMAGVIGAVSFFQLKAPVNVLAGVGGDWINSKFKRICRIKDSGAGLFTRKLLCGHGGLYDRIDAFWATVIINFLFNASFELF